MTSHVIHLGGDPVGPNGFGGDTPTLRLIALLEVIAADSHHFTLQELVERTRLPKPTLHRMLQQLEAAHLLHRESDGRRYAMASRLRRLAESLLFNDSLRGARQSVLRQVVGEIGESCNLTALSGSEVVYLDRVETSAPLRFYLQPGSRVPIHCSASGKLMLALMPAAQRRRLLGHAALEACTPHTKTSVAALEAELEQIAAEGFALDQEEFLPGLLCIAVPVPGAEGPPKLCIAAQAPIVRLGVEKAKDLLPALRRAAAAVARVDDDAGLARRAAP